MLHRWRNTNNGENFNLKRNNNKMVNIISNKKIIVKMLPTTRLVRTPTKSSRLKMILSRPEAPTIL